MGQSLVSGSGGGLVVGVATSNEMYVYMRIETYVYTFMPLLASIANTSIGTGKLMDMCRIELQNCGFVWAKLTGNA